jgi:tetratricopeptide (TPR) repeat protein
MAIVRSAFLLVLFWIPVATLHADEWPIARGPSREPLPYRYDPAVLKTIPKAFLDDASACILYAGTSHLVEPDGTVESVSHEITRLNSRKGIERLGEFRSIVFDPTYEKLTLNTARVLKRDGKIVEIEPKHVQLRDIGTDFQVYDQSKQVVISFPNLQVGDAYEVKWTIRGKNREFDGQFYTRYSFGDDQLPVLRDELRVRVPANKPLRHTSINGKIDLVVSEHKGERLYHWSVANRPELPKGEDRPSREELRLQVMVSTFPSWDAVGQWKHKLRKDCWECTPSVRKIVEDVTRGKEAQIEKAKALTYWVRRHVRYLSRGPGGLGYTPHMPHQVLDHLYGDCKDQAQLLAVMLREIGLPVWLVTLGTLDDGQVQPDVPSPWGSHAILLTQIDGKDHWIDTTVSIAPWDFLPRSDRNRQVYATRDAELKLLKTPEFTYQDYLIRQVTHADVQPDGSVQCRRESTHLQSAGWTRRDRLLEVPPGERRRFISAELQDAHNKAKLLTLSVDEKQLLDFDAPVRTDIAFELPKHFTGEGNLREGSFTDSPVWTWLLGYNIDPERRLPLVLPTPFESIHRYVVQLPAAYRLEGMPENRTVKSAWGSFALKVTADPKDARRIELHLHTTLEKSRVEMSEFARFSQFQDDVNRAYRVWLTLRPTSHIADAPLLEKRLATQANGDADTAKILAKLYLDHDRADDARRVLDQACKHFADDKAMWEMRVSAAKNVQEEEQHYRSLVKQFPNDPRYAVALGAVCIRREEYTQAVTILTPLTEHNLAAVRGAAHYQLARGAQRQKKPAEALKHLKAALFTDSASLATMDALHFKAGVHESLGQTKDAINCMLAALEADPNAREALAEIVRLELHAGMKGAALEHLRRYTIAAGKDGASLVKAASMHLELHRYEDAYECASRVSDAVHDAKAQRVLGLVHLARNEYAQAVLRLEKGELDHKALAGLIIAHVRIGDLDAALRHVEKSRNRKDRDGELAAQDKVVSQLVQRRNQLLEQWRPAKEHPIAAARILNRYLCAEHGMAERWPAAEVERLVNEGSSDEMPFAPMLALRGLLRLERGQLRKALADVDAAVKLDPKQARSFLVRGRIRLEQANPKAALVDLRKATQLSKQQDPIVLHWLAAALLDAGQTKDAVNTQRLALLLRPNDTELQDQLRRMERRLADGAGSPD